ncbi:hypothetical protein PaG_04132 [Moesziomyces aphidis]|uniref:Large ribosomal subunit protein eL39 n=1 Tax=Moesziomyces aphidis TaxID=84754 RepID=W3VJB6_MOEAP|nr:hypothetical protein PaG_04132 [Moesziomyces aphidis]
MPSQKTFRTKVKLAKAQKQNRQRVVDRSSRHSVDKPSRASPIRNTRRIIAFASPSPAQRLTRCSYASLYTLAARRMLATKPSIALRPMLASLASVLCIDAIDRLASLRRTLDPKPFSSVSARVRPNIAHAHLLDKLAHLNPTSHARANPASPLLPPPPPPPLLPLLPLPPLLPLLLLLLLLLADNKIQYNAKRRHWRRTKLNI